MHKGTTIKKELRQAADAAEGVTNSRTLELLARAGFAASGILHLLVGLIAIRLAMGGSGSADFSGAVSELSSQPAGPFLLWGSFAACAALAIWQASDAIFDYSHLPTKEKAGKKPRPPPRLSSSRDSPSPSPRSPWAPVPATTTSSQPVT